MEWKKLTARTEIEEGQEILAGRYLPGWPGGIWVTKKGIFRMPWTIEREQDIISIAGYSHYCIIEEPEN